MTSKAIFYDKANNRKFKRFSIAEEFSTFPGSRYIFDGDNSGELLRITLLANIVRLNIESNTPILIDLDGTAGYSTGFLEEAFGGLVRHHGFTSEEINRVLEFKSDEEPYLIDEIRGYINGN